MMVDNNKSYKQNIKKKTQQTTNLFIGRKESDSYHERVVKFGKWHVPNIYNQTKQKFQHSVFLIVNT